MNVTINARHCQIPDALRERVTERIERLSRYNPRLSGAEVTFDLNGGGHEVETLLTVDGSSPLVAHGTGADFRSAFDQSADRVLRQLKRKRERRVQKRQEAPAPLPGPSSASEA